MTGRQVPVREGDRPSLPPEIFLITPPFTQLNTPYPATAYLKGFLGSRGIPARQADLGIELILALFSQAGLTRLFEAIPAQGSYSENARRILTLREAYIRTIDGVIAFLQGKNPLLAYRIAQEGFLPEASRFSQLDDLEWAFGALGIQDKAKHLATLYLEDLSDLIQECLDPHFGFSRYAERLGRSARTFDELHEALQAPPGFMGALLEEALGRHMQDFHPRLVALTVPFPGNLFMAFRCAQWFRRHRPDTAIALGGGFANTELRSLSDPRVFDYLDFVTLDDGEAPMEHLWEHLNGQRSREHLKRTFLRDQGQVGFYNLSPDRDYPQAETGTPDYSDLPLDQYISVLEVANPMHRLWSDGRWNKLTMAHGCYWGKCTFCDVSLPYIRDYEPLTASLLCDRMEALIAATGQSGFHFVDEAAPPALMRELALEILRRGMTVTWWTNIRFEKRFTRDLCRLLRESGCIAVSGGLEVASDRLLALIQKGVTVAQVARVTRNFTAEGIMVHAYLMYGFPTQTVQETIDSLEMVRQLFQEGVLQSAYWHQFAMTAHAPTGLHPETFGVSCTTTGEGSFANNDLQFEDPTGIDHEAFSFGLKKSLLNFMHGIGLDFPLREWFDFKIPRTRISPDFISQALEDSEPVTYRPHTRLIWLGHLPVVALPTDTDKTTASRKKEWQMIDLHSETTLKMPVETGCWLQECLPSLAPDKGGPRLFQEFKEDYEAAGLPDFERFLESRTFRKLQEYGLLLI